MKVLKKIKLPFNRVSLWAWCVLIFLSAFAVRLYWIDQKEAFSVDEGLSLQFALYNNHIP